MVTPIFVCGAECGVDAIGTTIPAGSNRHWAAFGATVSVQSGGGKTRGAWSARSYKFNPSASANDTLQGFFPAAAIASPAVMVARVYIMFDVLPNAIRTILSETGGLCGIRYNPTGTKLEAWAGAATTVVAGSFVPSTGVWYRLDVRFTRNTTHTTEWQVDGAAQTTATKTVQAAAAITQLRLGSNSAGQGNNSNATATYYIDDMVVSGTSADYPIGAGQVVGLFPDSDGAHSMTANDFQASAVNMTNATTNAWSSLQNPLTATIGTFVAQVVIRNTGYAEFNLGAMPSAASISGLAAVSSHHGSTTGAHTQSLNLRDGSTDSVYLNLVDFSDLTMDFNYAIFALAPSTGTAWTKALLDAVVMRFGFSTDVTGNPILDGCCLEVDYVPSTGTSLALTPASVPVTAVAVAMTPAVSRALTPTAVPVAPVALARTVGAVSQALTPSTVPVTPVALGRVAANALTLTPATIPAAPQTLGRTAGAVSVALSPSSIPVTPAAVTLATTTALALTPVTIQAIPQAAGLTAGATLVALTPGTIPVTPIALAVAPGAVTALIAPTTVAVAAQTLASAPGAKALAVTPTAIPVVAISLGLDGANALGLTPSVVPVTPLALGLATATSLALSPTTITVDAVELPVSAAGSTNLALTPTTVTLEPVALGRTAGAVTVALSAPSLVTSPVAFGMSTGAPSRALAPAVVQVTASTLTVAPTVSLALSPTSVPVVPVAIGIAASSISSLALAPAVVTVTAAVVALGFVPHTPPFGSHLHIPDRESDLHAPDLDSALMVSGQSIFASHLVVTVRGSDLHVPDLESHLVSA